MRMGGQTLFVEFGFPAVGIFMLSGLLTFIFTRRMLGPIGLQPKAITESKRGKTYEWSVYLGTLLILPLIYIMITDTDYTDMFMYIIGPVTLVYLIYEMTQILQGREQKIDSGFGLHFLFHRVLGFL